MSGLALVAGCRAVPDQPGDCNGKENRELVEAIKYGVIPLQVNLPGHSRVDVPLSAPHPRFHPVPTRDVFSGRHPFFGDPPEPVNEMEAVLLPYTADELPRQDDEPLPLPPEPMQLHPILPASQLPAESQVDAEPMPEPPSDASGLISTPPLPAEDVGTPTNADAWKGK